MTPRKLIEPARLAGAALLRGQTDERLIDLTRAGNEKAFEAIVHRYRGPLLRYCARILPPGSAEDAVQQAFLNAYSAISSGDTDLKLRPWLYRIAHNSALNLLRQNGWNHEQLDEQFDGVLRPDQAVETRERIRSLVASVQELPERQRDAIVLRELEGRSYEEIAAALGVTDGAVRQLLNRARTALRAGATAVTPYGLAERIAMAASGGGGAVSARVAEICGAGAGGALTLAKIGTAVLVAGAVATSAANHDIPVVDAGHDTPSARGATPDGSLSGPNGSSDSRAGGGQQAGRGERGRDANGRSNANRRGGHRSGPREHADGGQDHVQLVNGNTSSGEHSGTTGGDGGRSGSSGPGPSGSSDGGSMDGGGPGPSGTSGTSGDGSSGSSGPGPSGSGTSGSGTSGSSDGGSTTTTTTTGSSDGMSGSGTSGSRDGGSTTTTQTTTTSTDGDGGTSGGPH